MRWRRFIHSLSIVSVVLTLCAIRESCRAESVLLGPSPYLSAADSPFPVDGSDPNFFLEDFEPYEPCIPGEGVICGAGKFDVPGAQLIYGTPVQGPSVEPNGHSAVATHLGIVIGGSNFYAIGVEFDRDELGFWPTSVGMVLTDGSGPFSGLSVYDTLGNRTDFATGDLGIDPLNPASYRFIGAFNPQGISAAVFIERIFDNSPSAIPRIDHFQYGNAIPEPSTTFLVCTALTIFNLLVRHSDAKVER